MSLVMTVRMTARRIVRKTSPNPRRQKVCCLVVAIVLYWATNQLLLRIVKVPVRMCPHLRNQ